MQASAGDEERYDRRLREYGDLPLENRALDLARWLFKRLYRLATAKWTSTLPLMPGDESEPDEEDLYQDCRTCFLFCLRSTEHDDLADRATQFLPDRLLTITNGGVDVWDSAAAHTMASELSVLCENAGLGPYRHLLDRQFSGIDGAITWIRETTTQLGQIARALRTFEELEADGNQLDVGRQPVRSPIPTLLLSPLLATDQPTRLVPAPEAEPTTKSRKGVGGAPKRELNFDLYMQLWAEMHFVHLYQGSARPTLHRMATAYAEATNTLPFHTNTIRNKFRDSGRVWPPKWRAPGHTIKISSTSEN